jgi:hypothetical protein
MSRSRRLTSSAAPVLLACYVATFASILPARADVPEREARRAEAVRKRTLAIIGVFSGVILTGAGAYLLHRGLTTCERAKNKDDCWIGEVAGGLFGAPMMVMGVSGVGAGAYLWGSAASDLQALAAESQDGISIAPLESGGALVFRARF